MSDGFLSLVRLTGKRSLWPRLLLQLLLQLCFNIRFSFSLSLLLSLFLSRLAMILLWIDHCSNLFLRFLIVFKWESL